MALPGRKSLRQFQCNDTLWVTFRRMAEDQEKEVDEVIAEALEAYAQLSGYQTGINALEAESQQMTPPPRQQEPPRAPAPPPPPPPTPPPARSRFARMPEPSGLSMFDGPATPPPHPHAHGAPPMGFDGTPAAQPQIPLYLVFDNQKYRIDKDQFIIGRGTKSSDLPIKDGNISRKHAAVIRRNGTYFIKDLGSTNGIDFKGMRIDNKRIEEGDVFHLCDYELRFTFKR
ncbi:MAG TPA: FHA domain-containing protein [Polyangia bacterium]|nr:FHA domain-containing protein [Polyangia bacterium]